MNEPPAPAILPPTNQPAVYGPVYSTGAAPKQKFPVVPVLLVCIILVGLFIGMQFRTAKSTKQVKTAPTSTPTATPKASPNQALSSFATSSAFLQFEAAVDALPAAISGATMLDTSLNPPTVDLSLGFQKQ